MYTHEMNECIQCIYIEWMFRIYMHWMNVNNEHTLNKCLQCTYIEWMSAMYNVHTLSECLQCKIYIH